MAQGGDHGFARDIPAAFVCVPVGLEPPGQIASCSGIITGNPTGICANRGIDFFSGIGHSGGGLAIGRRQWASAAKELHHLGKAPAIGLDGVGSIPAIRQQAGRGDGQHLHCAAVLVGQQVANADHRGHAWLFVRGLEWHGGFEGFTARLTVAEIQFFGRRVFALAVAVWPGQHGCALQPIPRCLGPRLAATGPAGHGVDAGGASVQAGLQHIGFLFALDQDHGLVGGGQSLAGQVQRAGFVELLPLPCLRAVFGAGAPGIGQIVLAAIAGGKAHHVAHQIAAHRILGGAHDLGLFAVVVLECGLGRVRWHGQCGGPAFVRARGLGLGRWWLGPFRALVVGIALHTGHVFQTFVTGHLQRCFAHAQTVHAGVQADQVAAFFVAGKVGPLARGQVDAAAGARAAMQAAAHVFVATGHATGQPCGHQRVNAREQRFGQLIELDGGQRRPAL